jgi:hypothetical protein
MTTTISSQIEIDAPAETVWAILMDFPAYGEWNPFIRQISGPPEVGARLEARLQPPGGRAMTFKPTVLVADPNREFRWLGRLLVKGLFDGEHVFRIEPLGGDRVRFVQEESFAGILVPLLKGTLGQAEQGFHAMNAALKGRAEGMAEGTVRHGQG